MKIVYAGTPEFAVPPLKALLDSEHEVVAVITQRDKPTGRKGIVTPSPVKRVAEEHGVPVFQPDRIRDCAEEVKALGGEVMVTCAFGQILSAEILNLFPRGVWNVHASLLPKYRGASPIQHCILNGEKYTGVTIMQTETGLDTGGILLVKRTEILPRETAGELSARLSVLGAEALKEALLYIAKGETQLLLQDEAQATVCKKITKDAARIDWNAPAQKIVNLVRAMNPAPVAYTLLDGQPLNVYALSAAEYNGGEQNGTILRLNKTLAVKCQGGAVVVEELQFSGGKRISGRDALNGRKLTEGQVLQ